MSRNKTILIVAASILLMGVIFVSLTEFRDVSAYNWTMRYDFEDEEPNGLYIFKEMVDRYFEDIPQSVNSELTDSSGTDALYIQFVPRNMDNSHVDRLKSMASSGNDVLIISDRFNDYLSDTLPHFFENWYQFDSTLTFNFTHQDIARDTNFSYSFQNREFDKTEEHYFYLLHGLNEEYDMPYIRVAAADSLALMVSFDVGDGRLFYHVRKDLFYNHSYRQPGMFDYTQRLLSHFDPSHVYLLNPLTIFSSGNIENENPLEFIMSQPALKAAYYLLIIGTLLYVFFGGKRKQKVIPVMERNENTSLEYIETVSQLFYQQDQHEKLVAHMRNIFYHKMQKKFFITPDQDDYIQVLSKKSKISISELRYVLQRFQELDKNYQFTADQLESLNQRLESIYKEIEN